MGRYYIDKKIEADVCISVDVSDLKDSGLLPTSDQYSPITRFEWKRNEKPMCRVSIVVEKVDIKEKNLIMELSYTLLADENQSQVYTSSHHLLTTSCNYGGHRYWFQCDSQIKGETCKRRVGKLYLVRGIFACRHCHRLTYMSQNENRRSEIFPILNSFLKLKRAYIQVQKVRRPYYKGLLTRRAQIHINLTKEVKVMLNNDKYEKGKVLHN